MLTHFSLFSGVGGLDLAAEWAGFLTVGQVEIDDYCTRALEKHWPDVPKWRDVRDVTRQSVRATGIGAIDVISGGFPCQPFSQAGRRGGTADDRYLWPEMLRVIDELRPAWVIAENVNGIVGMELEVSAVTVEGRTIGRFEDHDFYTAVLTRQEIMLLGTACNELEEKGYEVQPIVIPACAVEAPHERARVFLVGYSDIMRSPQFGQTGRMGRGMGAGEDAGELGSRGNAGPTQPRLGNSSNGLPSRLAGLGGRWPAGWWPTPTVCGNYNRKGASETSGDGLATAVRWPAPPGEQYPWEPPRVATGVKDRVQKLRALGNAVCPAQAYPIFKAIYEIEVTR